ncbi:MAG: mandelate racemase/muconate lactonizing protein, partial [Thermoplasmata archaeon]
LGGPTREKIPAYASMLGCSLKPEDIVKRCQEYVDKGFTAMKWFFRYGPGSGVAGMKKNVELVWNELGTTREEVRDGLDRLEE